MNCADPSNTPRLQAAKHNRCAYSRNQRGGKGGGGATAEWVGGVVTEAPPASPSAPVAVIFAMCLNHNCYILIEFEHLLRLVFRTESNGLERVCVMCNVM